MQSTIWEKVCMCHVSDLWTMVKNHFIQEHVVELHQRSSTSSLTLHFQVPAGKKPQTFKEIDYSISFFAMDGFLSAPSGNVFCPALLHVLFQHFHKNLHPYDMYYLCGVFLFYFQGPCPAQIWFAKRSNKYIRGSSGSRYSSLCEKNWVFWAGGKYTVMRECLWYFLYSWIKHLAVLFIFLLWMLLLEALTSSECRLHFP